MRSPASASPPPRTCSLRRAPTCPASLTQDTRWARQSAGRSKAATTGKGNPWLGGTLGEAATSAARTKTFLASRYKRIARRRGRNRAVVATGNSLLTIIWHLLSDPDARFTDLGPDWHDRLAPLRRKRQLIAGLERLSGKKVTLEDAA
jgi:transposase